jgi:archaellum component FlaC|tara:strand:- start:1212 stop:1451 length:240 start_codon:yes stop_codon:yes gene_type:complete
MTEVNLQDDLNAVNDQLTKLVEELNKLNTAREQVVQQIQNLNGVAMYLRGKLPEDVEAPIIDMEESTDDLERSAEYPTT